MLEKQFYRPVLQPKIKASATKSEKFFRWRVKRFNAAVLELEDAYERILQSGKTSIKDALLAAYLVLKVHAFTFETYFLIFAIWALAFSSSTFLAHPIEGHVHQLLPSLMSIALATLIPPLMAFVTISTQVIFKIRVSVMALVHAGLTALALSLIQPYFLETVFEIEGVPFIRLFVMMFTTFLITNLYMILHLKDIVCIVNFERHKLVNGHNAIIPPHKRGALIGLSAQDHYVEFITDKGNHLHRISMKEAVALIPKDTGMHVHRSHWVAFDAMHALEKTSGRFTLTLKNRTTIPVTAANALSVQAILDAL